MKIKVRRAQVSDIPQLVDKMENFYGVLREKGAKDVNDNEQVLRGGITIEVGYGFNNPDWHCIVAVDKEANKVIAFMIGIFEYCSPVDQVMSRVRIHATGLENDSFIGPRVLTVMWNEMEKWATQRGAGYFYANIHPGNQPSVRIAKKTGFKHHYTQFYRPIKLETTEEV